ncbi:protein lethal(2)essential for life-like [Temnothorax nylanderi]|uniref:protein lethal(2)essential for life-like n=1 Tax=Temnothorax nylanderi TaxID=102681 RepID=UPI003A8C339B
MTGKIQERRFSDEAFYQVISIRKKQIETLVVLDVQHFEPEISVKIVDDHLVVEAKHEDRQDRHGWVSRQFVHRYPLPQDIDVNNMMSKLFSNGLLALVAPKKRPLKDESVRTLRIECTGKPFVQKQEKSKTLEQGEKEKKQE